VSSTSAQKKPLALASAADFCQKSSARQAEHFWTGFLDSGDCV